MLIRTKRAQFVTNLNLEGRRHITEIGNSLQRHLVVVSTRKKGKKSREENNQAIL